MISRKNSRGPSSFCSLVPELSAEQGPLGKTLRSHRPERLCYRELSYSSWPAANQWDGEGLLWLPGCFSLVPGAEVPARGLQRFPF